MTTRRHALASTIALVAACAPADAPPPAPTPLTAPPPDTAATTTTPAAPVTTTAAPVPPVPRAPASTAPAPVVPPAGGGGDVVALICAAWGDECARAVRVARCESGLRPGATNGPHLGLMQINVRIHARRIAAMGYTEAQMLEAGPNIAVAHALWLEQGWGPWTCAA